MSVHAPVGISRSSGTNQKPQKRVHKPNLPAGWKAIIKNSILDEKSRRNLSTACRTLKRLVDSSSYGKIYAKFGRLYHRSLFTQHTAKGSEHECFCYDSQLERIFIANGARVQVLNLSAQVIQTMPQPKVSSFKPQPSSMSITDMFYDAQKNLLGADTCDLSGCDPVVVWHVTKKIKPSVYHRTISDTYAHTILKLDLRFIDDELMSNCWLEADKTCNRVITGSKRTIKIWDTQTKESIFETRSRGVTFSNIQGRNIYDPTHKWLITAVVNEKGDGIDIVDVISGKILYRFNLNKQNYFFKTLHFDPKSKQVFMSLLSDTESPRCLLGVWKLEDSSIRIIDPKLYHYKPNFEVADSVNNIDYDADTGTLFTAGFGIQLWNIENMSKIIEIDLERPIQKMILDRENRKLLVLQMTHRFFTGNNFSIFDYAAASKERDEAKRKLKSNYAAASKDRGGTKGKLKFGKK